MLNAIEKSTIAKYVSDYLIEHLLIDEPMSADEMAKLIIDITEDLGISDHSDFEKVTALAIDMVSKDPRVIVKTKDNGNVKASWIYHKESPQLGEEMR